MSTHSYIIEHIVQNPTTGDWVNEPVGPIGGKPYRFPCFWSAIRVRDHLFPGRNYSRTNIAHRRSPPNVVPPEDVECSAVGPT